MPQEARLFEKEIVKTVRLQYLLYLPPDYARDTRERWPLILFLHGAGERGDELGLIKKHGLPKILDERSDFPFIVVSPQCPECNWWAMETEALGALLDEIAGAYRVDPQRVYLTGLSMGGFGTWHLALEQPQCFAAIAPICGGIHGPSRIVCTLKDLPIWAFHGAKDETVPLDQQARLVEALRECGGNVRFTVYPEAGHDSWTETYNNPELYDWFLQHSR